MDDTDRRIDRQRQLSRQFGREPGIVRVEQCKPVAQSGPDPGVAGGSRTAVASTNDAFCPVLRGAVRSELGPDIISVLEIVIDGVTSKSVADAMRAGLRAVLEAGATKGVTRVSAGNYGGKLGQHHYHLKDLLA